MAFLSNRSTWLTAYHALAQDEGKEKTAFESELSSYDEPSKSILNDEATLLNLLVGDGPSYILLLPSTRAGYLNVLHSCQHDENREHGPYAIGVHGIKLSDPWKAFRTQLAVGPLQPPSSTRSCPTIPSLQQLTSITEPDEFAKLTGKEDGRKVKEIETIPNTFFLHPRLFLACIEDSSIKAEDLAYKIIMEVANQQDSDEDAGPSLSLEALPDWKHTQAILTYLWFVARGFSKSVNLDSNGISDTATAQCRECEIEVRAFLKFCDLKKNQGSSQPGTPIPHNTGNNLPDKNNPNNRRSPESNLGVSDNRKDTSSPSSPHRHHDSKHRSYHHRRRSRSESSGSGHSRPHNFPADEPNYYSDRRRGPRKPRRHSRSRSRSRSRSQSPRRHSNADTVGTLPVVGLEAQTKAIPVMPPSRFNPPDRSKR